MNQQELLANAREVLAKAKAAELEKLKKGYRYYTTNVGRVLAEKQPPYIDTWAWAKDGTASNERATALEIYQKYKDDTAKCVQEIFKRCFTSAKDMRNEMGARIVLEMQKNKHTIYSDKYLFFIFVENMSYKDAHDKAYSFLRYSNLEENKELIAKYKKLIKKKKVQDVLFQLKYSAFTMNQILGGHIGKEEAIDKILKI